MTTLEQSTRDSGTVFCWFLFFVFFFGCARFGVCCLFIVQEAGTITQNCTYIQNEDFPLALPDGAANLQFMVQRCSGGEASVELKKTRYNVIKVYIFFFKKMFAFSAWTLKLSTWLGLEEVISLMREFVQQTPLQSWFVPSKIFVFLQVFGKL